MMVKPPWSVITGVHSMILFSVVLMAGCGSSGGDEGIVAPAGNQNAGTSSAQAGSVMSSVSSVGSSVPASSVSSAAASSVAAVDITNSIFTNTSGSCADYAQTLFANVMDIQESQGFEANVVIVLEGNSCLLMSNAIPNHNFNDSNAHFAHAVSAISRTFTIAQIPVVANAVSALSQRMYDAVMLNGVVVDLLSAGCYNPSSPMADSAGNTPAGCTQADGWLLDPLGEGNNFGTDIHNAHVQPDGTYHYHGNPNALFDDNPGPNGSPVIGFAADGFPIYGSYFSDIGTGAVRKALSGYTLKAGARPNGANDPGGNYDGMYVDDWEFADSGDLDICNGMTVAGQYGYYVTDSYPWVLGCLVGTANASFIK